MILWNRLQTTRFSTNHYQDPADFLLALFNAYGHHIRSYKISCLFSDLHFSCKGITSIKGYMFSPLLSMENHIFPRFSLIFGWVRGPEPSRKMLLLRAAYFHHVFAQSSYFHGGGALRWKICIPANISSKNIRILHIKLCTLKFSLSLSHSLSITVLSVLL